MNIVESLRVAFGALLSNRLRSILTMLGIIIGVSAVVTLVTLGQGFQDYITGTFQSIGSNLLFIIATRPNGPNAKLIKAKPLTMDDVQAIGNPVNVPGIAAVVPSYIVGTTIVANGNSVSLAITGTTANWEDVRDWHAADGRFIDDTDVNTTARVAVLGTGVRKKLFGTGGDVVGQTIRINDIPFTVIGVLTEKGGPGPQDEILVMPITTGLTRLGDAAARTSSGAYEVTVMVAQAVSKDRTQEVKQGIERVLADRHKVQYQGDEDFMVVTQDQVLSILSNITGLLTIFLAVVAGISLLVGGIGVMNIMLVSVTERTREIGLRKALGARRRDLMGQFLIESIVLTISGGAIGVLLGSLAALGVGKAVPSLPVAITLPAILLATGVSTAIGIFFGLYPATRAAALSPIEALRYE